MSVLFDCVEQDERLFSEAIRPIFMVIGTAKGRQVFAEATSKQREELV